MKVIVGYVSETDEAFASFLPSGCCYIHAVLASSGHQSLLVNFSGMPVARRDALIRENRPRVLFLSLLTHNRHCTLRLAKAVKLIDPKCLVIVGGPHATFLWHDILDRNEAVDGVVLGEGERVCREIAAAVADGRGVGGLVGVVTRTNYKIRPPQAAPVCPNLDELPIPGKYAAASVGVDLRRQLEFIITSRGCGGSCSFCSSPSFWGRKIRYRSPASVVEEIRFLRDTYGMIYFSIRDDTFTCDRSRVVEICRRLLDERIFVIWNCQSRVNAVDAEVLQWMRRAGCEAIQFGVESGSSKVLASLAKGVSLDRVRAAARMTKESGIRLSVYLITGVPGEGESDLQETLSVISDIQADDGQVSPLVYYPGTKFFRDAVAKGEVEPQIFDGMEESFPVRRDSFVRKSMSRMLRRLHEVGTRHCLNEKTIRSLRNRFGYCHIGNIGAGEFYRSIGDDGNAEAAFREIVKREPDNPWGWLSLAELHADQGKFVQAIADFRRLVDLVPNHAPAFAALGDLFLQIGQRDAANEAIARADELDPWGEGRQAILL